MCLLKEDSTITQLARPLRQAPCFYMNLCFYTSNLQKIDLCAFWTQELDPRDVDALRPASAGRAPAAVAQAVAADARRSERHCCDPAGARRYSLGGRGACRLVAGINESAAHSRVAKLAVKVRALLNNPTSVSSLPPSSLPPPPAPNPPPSLQPPTVDDNVWVTDWDLPPLQATLEPPGAILPSESLTRTSPPPEAEQPMEQLPPPPPPPVLPATLSPALPPPTLASARLATRCHATALAVTATLTLPSVGPLGGVPKTRAALKLLYSSTLLAACTVYG